MGRLDGKVASITGAARGQGRSHAEAMAAEGADIVGIDLCAQLDTVSYPMATLDDLEETVSLVENHGRRMVARRSDVRDLGAVCSAVEEGLAEFGRLHIVVANAGIMAHSPPPYRNSEQVWKDSIDTMLTGVWNTFQATVPTSPITLSRSASAQMIFADLPPSSTTTRLSREFGAHGIQEFLEHKAVTWPVATA